MLRSGGYDDRSGACVCVCVCVEEDLCEMVTSKRHSITGVVTFTVLWRNYYE